MHANKSVLGAVFRHYDLATETFGAVHLKKARKLYLFVFICVHRRAFAAHNSSKVAGHCRSVRRA